jgi:hypothetical protein
MAGADTGLGHVKYPFQNKVYHPARVVKRGLRIARVTGASPALPALFFRKKMTFLKI